MMTTSEIVLPIGNQKHDPAWKHCLMIRSNGRTKLKCIYCMKLFLGGGIHRIKEHLARHKGNAACCPKVPLEVQHAMQHSLDGAAIRKKRKIKLADEVGHLNPTEISAAACDIDHSANSGLQIVPLNEMLDLGTVQMEAKEDSCVTPLPRAAKSAERGRKRRTKNSSMNHMGPSSTLGNDGSWVNRSSLVQAVDKEQVYHSIGRFLYEAGVPLEAVNSVYFQPMVEAIAAFGPGLELPSYHDFRGGILKRLIEEVNLTLEHYKRTWGHTGCSILADECSTMEKTLINFFVYCPEGTMFLRCVDATEIVATADTLYELLKHVVEDVGPNNVIQVITNNSDIHAFAGKRLTETFPTLFWSPCASQCIDLILEDFSKMDSMIDTIESAKSLTRFIYRTVPVLNMMKKYTHGKDLLRPASSRAAMNFVALKSLVCLKEELRNMVTSEEWLESPYSKKPDGVAMANLILNSLFWISCAAINRITEPLVQLLKLVESKKRPAMGYVHLCLYLAKDAIRKEFVKKSDYMPYWDLIDWRWDKQLPRPLHAAGFFLNPQLFYSTEGQISNEISSGMLDCIERLVPEAKVQDKIQKELNYYRGADRDFSRKIAVRARRSLLPAEWWSTYGGSCPNLTRLAIHILSQTCSARGPERTHIPFEQLHNEKLNFSERQRLCELVYVRYNLRLQQRHVLKNRCFDPISVDNIDVVDDWVGNHPLFSADADSSWLVFNQPESIEQQSESSLDEVETLISALDDDVIRSAGRGIEDNDEIKEEEDNHDDSAFT
ncbi:uncharacterized protein LOC110018198 isoform X1 [Phalaenopsis equestris]|uniref:uncharacterized protein LOC110018198 isoform X1 n=1 Tax=Phalaenopsis equestris TaxID=78828 RepID=UPI0009E1B540|nr:uncharacterized protein LOC110018198 isoform X1 [Phalaenopsis equestris]XP_020571094.1 uncharacterized protein LOC110018198 isoform X1 [Phalaenopsis equestris]XP_020571095.1 uncharacterized protein LOC110018198 isoform X1 [Phalaenopsis equestris]